MLSGPVFDDATAAVQDARVVIMNPPFTNRIKMGEKFARGTKQRLRDRMDQLEHLAGVADSSLSEFLHKNSLRPHFVALADLCIDRSDSVLTSLKPTIALLNTSGAHERRFLANRYHVHTILTVRQTRDVGLSQNSDISESILVLKRDASAHKPDTRIVTLDRYPSDQTQADDLTHQLKSASDGGLIHGWGEVSYWPRTRIEQGDWTAPLWRSPELADAAYEYANHRDLVRLNTVGLSGYPTGPQLSNGYACSTVGTPCAFPILDSSSVDVQTCIRGEPDEHWIWRGEGDPPILSKRSHLLITTGQYMPSARLTAVASDHAYVGRGWWPVRGCSAHEAKGLAVFVNSTVGRLILMRGGARTIHRPQFNTTTTNHMMIPNIRIPRIVRHLADCWESTRHEKVPRNDEGYTSIRRTWDQAVSEAMTAYCTDSGLRDDDWTFEKISRLGELLHMEPQMRGAAQGQWRE